MFSEWKYQLQNKLDLQQWFAKSVWNVESSKKCLCMITMSLTFFTFCLQNLYYTEEGNDMWAAPHKNINSRQ